MIRSVKLLTGVLLLCLAGLWAEVPQAFLGKSARLELDGVQFYLEHYNGAWQRTIDRNVVVEQSSQEPIPKRVGRIQTVDGKFRFVLTLAPQSDGQELSLAVTTEQPISTQIVAMTLNIPCGVLPVVPVSINGKDALLKMPEKQQMLRQGRASSLVLPGQTGQIVMTGENFSYSLNYNTHTGKRYLMRLICTPNETKTEYRLKVKFAWRPVKLVQFPLAKAANMGFVDNVEGDRKGGWTDQGPTADLRSLKSGRHSAGQFYFDIPGERRAIVLSGGLARPYFPVTVTVPSVSGNYAWLYLVHTSAWARNQKTPGTVTACYQDGTEQRFPVTFGEELIDWTEQEEDLPNGNIVWQGTTPKFPKILLFASRFPLDRNKTLTGVRFDSSKQAVWGIVSVSAQPDGPACAFYERNQHETFQEGPDWAVIDWQPKVPVLPGSALDLSQQRNPFDGPGARIVIRDGHFEREDTPGKRVFLNGINLCQEVTYPPKEIAEDMALRLAKNGYNAVRLHHFDWRLSSPGAPNIDLRENFNRFFYLIHQLEKNGIYYSIDYFSQRRVSKEMAALPLRQVLNKTKSLL
ncbi:MAG: hypothetical protein IJJ26_02810, partial [Victivallales bacterium]|nr:hypothetical protein [Victivallales bacterium]